MENIDCNRCVHPKKSKVRKCSKYTKVNAACYLSHDQAHIYAQNPPLFNTALSLSPSPAQHDKWAQAGPRCQERPAGEAGPGSPDQAQARAGQAQCARSAGCVLPV